MGQKYAGGAVDLTLNGAIASGVSPGADGTFAVNETPTGWPTLGAGAGNTAVCQIGSEKILLKAISGTTFTVSQRGYDGTTATAHADDAPVLHLGDAASWQRFQDHIDDTVDAHDASAISYAGATGMAATDVEAAIDELSVATVVFYETITFSKSGSLAADETHYLGWHRFEEQANDVQEIVQCTWVAGTASGASSTSSFYLETGPMLSTNNIGGGTFSTAEDLDALAVAVTDATYLRAQVATGATSTLANAVMSVTIKHTVTLVP